MSLQHLAPQPLAGKVAIVTGAAGGIGHAYARALGEAGAAVMLADLNGEGARANATSLTPVGVEARATAVDITDPASARAMVAETVGAFGGVDILVNNAAMMAEIPLATPLVELDLAIWRKVLDVNLTGALVCVQAVVPEMSKRGSGKIINQVSGGAFMPAGVYGVSKLGLVSLTASLAHQLAPLKINVNAIAPGYVNTDAGRRAAPPEIAKIATAGVPLKGVGETDDLLGGLLFLASSASDWVTGQTLSIDGGWIMRL